MMLTRCPACQTAFRLGPEQLHARRGEVRCGHCFHPFNALEHEIVQRGQTRSPTPAPATPVSPVSRSAASVPAPPALAPTLDFIILEEKPPPASDSPARPSTTSALPTHTSVAPDLDFDIPTEFPPTQHLAASTAAFGATVAKETRAPLLPEVVRSSRRHAAETAPTEPAWTAPSAPKDGLAAESRPDFTWTQKPVPAAHQGAERASHAQSEGREEHAEDASHASSAQVSTSSNTAPIGIQPAPDTEPADIKPAYIDVERLDAKYGRLREPASPLLRTLAGLAAGVLGGMLVAQSLFLYRMELTRELPGLRPLLTRVCAELGCEIPFPSDAELIALDASDLQSEPGKPGQYVLHATVNNRAEYAQTWPHMELTLTDARDLPIARRVLAPKEWLPADQRGEDQNNNAFASHKVISARIPFAAPDVAPTGYRVYIFYP